MGTWEFALIGTHPDAPDGDYDNLIYERVGNDVTVSYSKGKVRVDFLRESDTMMGAALLAAEQLDIIGMKNIELVPPGMDADTA